MESYHIDWPRISKQDRTSKAQRKFVLFYCFLTLKCKLRGSEVIVPK